MAAPLRVAPILLTAALIVRDEERYLADCLTSLQPVVDEVVVVDTGSQDSSPALAARFGARVEHFTWCDDFSAARNHALDLARGEWILYIDADERVRPVDVSPLRALMRNPRTIAAWVLLHVHPEYTPYHELRLFRNDPRIRFKGVIHETIWPSIRDLLQAGFSMDGSDLEIDHVGYIGDQAHKVARNLPLLLREAAADPDRVYLWCELGKAYELLDRQLDAREMFEKAVAVARSRGSERDWNDSVAYVCYIGWLLRRREAPDALIEEALQLFPRNRQLRWNLVCRHMDRGEFARALEALEQVLAEQQPLTVDMQTSYDRRILGEFAFEARAVCHFKLGQYAEAARDFTLALETRPDREDLRGQLEIMRRLSGSGLE